MNKSEGQGIQRRKLHSVNRRTDADPVELGARIAFVREKGKRTQSEFAKFIPMSISHLSKLEAGIGFASPPLVAMIANRCGVSEKWLITGEEDAGSVRQAAEVREIAPANTQAQCSLEDVRKIIALSTDPESIRRAKQVADGLVIPESEALAMVVRTRLREK